MYSGIWEVRPSYSPVWKGQKGCIGVGYLLLAGFLLYIGIGVYCSWQSLNLYISMIEVHIGKEKMIYCDTALDILFFIVLYSSF